MFGIIYITFIEHISNFLIAFELMIFWELVLMVYFNGTLKLFS